MEQGSGGAREARSMQIRSADLAARTRELLQELAPHAEQRLDGAVVWGTVCKGPAAGELQARLTVGGRQMEDALGCAQPLDDAIGQQCIDELGAGRSDALGLR